MTDVKKLEKLFSQGQISRREFITRMSALGITAAVAPGLLVKSAHAATPKRGGRLRIGTTGGSTSDSLDPALVVATMQIEIGWQLRNDLAEIDADGNAIPELAESWECSPDAKKWIFKIRQGVEFHNGKTLDAEDVLFSINHHRKEDTKSYAKALLADIVELKADGKYAITCSLAAGNADLPFVFAGDSLTIVPAGTTDFEKGIGTGGYELVSWEPGVRALVKRNPNYWKQGRAHFDEVETLNIVDTASRTTALMTGKVDVINRVDFKTADRVQDKPGLQIVRAKGLMHYSMPMLTDLDPYNNNDVRLALKYAIDREHLLKTILRGYGTVGNDHPVAPAQMFYAPEIPQRQYDPEKAKYYIKKAGMEDHIFRLHTADGVFPGATDTAVLYQEHAAKAGINIEVVREPDDGYWNSVWMKKPWSFCYWSGRPTVDLMFSLAYWSEASWNDSHWKNERFDKLLLAARSELNKAKRQEMYTEMQQIVRDEGGVVIPLFADHVHGATEKLKYGKVSGIREFDCDRLAERWWFA